MATWLRPLALSLLKGPPERLPSLLFSETRYSLLKAQLGDGVCELYLVTESRMLDRGRGYQSQVKPTGGPDGRVAPFAYLARARYTQDPI